LPGLPAALTTLVPTAQPNTRQDFRFSGDLDGFNLDNIIPDDSDAYTRSKTFEVGSGVYTVNEHVSGSWF
jgi:hypothetical protein